MKIEICVSASLAVTLLEMFAQNCMKQLQCHDMWKDIITIHSYELTLQVVLESLKPSWWLSYRLPITECNKHTWYPELLNYFIENGALITQRKSSLIKSLQCPAIQIE